jgi:hypothetical protein
MTPAAKAVAKPIRESSTMAATVAAPQRLFRVLAQM